MARQDLSCGWREVYAKMGVDQPDFEPSTRQEGKYE